MIRLGILGSTRGSSLEPVIKAIVEGVLEAKICLIGSDRAQAGILTKAVHHQIAHCHGDETQLSNAMSDAQVDLIVLVGFMKILSPAFVAAWQKKIINIHPSLLPKHAGLINLAVHQSVIDHGDTTTGCTVHFVDEGVDTGEILLQRTCQVEPGDSAELLKHKVQALEGDALISAIRKIDYASTKNSD